MISKEDIQVTEPMDLWSYHKKIHGAVLLERDYGYDGQIFDDFAVKQRIRADLVGYLYGDLVDFLRKIRWQIPDENKAQYEAILKHIEDLVDGDQK